MIWKVDDLENGFVMPMKGWWWTLSINPFLHHDAFPNCLPSNSNITLRNGFDISYIGVCLVSFRLKNKNPSKKETRCWNNELHPRKLTWIPKMMGLGKGNGTLKWRHFWYLYVRFPSGEYIKDRGIRWVWPLPATVSTRIITFLVGDSYKPLFTTVTGMGPHPRYTCYLKFSSFRLVDGEHLHVVGVPEPTFMKTENPKSLTPIPHLPVTYIFGTRGSSYLIYWQLGAWFQIYWELEDQGMLRQKRYPSKKSDPRSDPRNSRTPSPTKTWASTVIALAAT